MTRVRARQILNCASDILLLLFAAGILLAGIMPLPEIVAQFAQFGAGR